LLGLAGPTAAARLMGAFEAVLTSHVMIAFFVPAIVYMADAVGTQTETLVIRGLSLGVPLARIARRELITGLLIGAVLAGLFVPVGLLPWRDTATILVVAVALFLF
jgi:magnesium transporter